MKEFILPHAWSLRARITLGSLVVVGAVLGGAAFALVRLQLRTLDESIDSGLAIRADDIEAQVRRGALDPEPAIGDEEIAVVQVVSSNGQVVAASANMRGQPAIEVPPPASRADRVSVVDGLPFEDEPFRVLSRAVVGPGGSFTILVARSRDDAIESSATLARMLWIGVPLVTLVAAGGTWLLVGRALAPVEAIRREVAGIGEADLRRRVPEPNGSDEIARLAKTMNEMLARVEAAYEGQQAFVADAAHELRSPLASLRAQLEVGAGDDVDLLAEVVRLQRLTNDLLLLASPAEQRRGGDERGVDLDDIVFEEVRRARLNSSVEIDSSGVSAAATRGNRERLARVVQNLLENATRHAATTVRVGLTEVAGEVLLSVADDGPGVRPEDRERIFGRFARTDSGRSRDSGGTGLGLAITRAIVESFGGRVWVDPGYLDGARFVVELPPA